MVKKRSSRRMLSIATTILIFLLFYNIIFSKSSSIDSLILADDDDDTHVFSLVYEYKKHGMFLYKMNEPIETFWSFECIDTKMLYTLNTKLCIHDVKFDQHVSGQLKQHGLWEPNNVRSFIKQMMEVPDANFIDIGANIGLYTLIAAKYNRSVIAVEPLHENLIRIHKAAVLENVQRNIVALVNAISNERKQVNILLVDDNLGGSFVMEMDAGGMELTQSSVIVNSILLDDLVDVVKGRFSVGKSGDRIKFILKIDIESYEPFAFENCTILFQQFDIVAIYLEFGKILEKLLKNVNGYLEKVLKMVNMFEILNYDVYEINGYNKLEYREWRRWPWDVYLRQCDLIVCPGRSFKVIGV
jgi:FkbM family methyltransferase